MKRIDTYIFDIDGTLIDTLHGATAAVNAILIKFNLPLITEDEASEFIHDGVEYFIQQAAKTNDIMQVKQMVDAYQKYYFEHCEASAYEEVLATLKYLHSKGKKVGVFTNKPKRIACKQMKQSGIYPLLDFVKADDGNTVLKPYPDTIFTILKEQKSNSHSTVIVGDSTADIIAGKQANIWTCYAAYGIGVLQKSLNPDYSIDNFTQILDCFE